MIFAILALSLLPQTGQEEKVVKKTLPNGLRLLILPRGEAPVVSFHTYVDVGGVDERVGITGVAHVFEHMAFKGSAALGSKDWEREKEALDAEEAAFLEWREAKKRAASDPKLAEELKAKENAFREAVKKAGSFVSNEAFSATIESAGGVGLNATTNADATQYFYSLPANKLELWAWLESERFARPVLREFYKETDVVKEERRMRTESSPTGQLMEAFLASAFLAHPYGSPVVGHMSDLHSLSRTEAEAFYREHYSPAGTVVAVVGAIDPEQAIPMLERYFGRIPAGAPPQRVVTQEPEQKGERRVEVETRANPSVMIGWHRPDWRHADDPALDALADLLAGGRYARLYGRLVKQEQIATSVNASSNFPGAKYPSLFLISAVPAPEKTTEECEKAIYEEIAKLGADGPTSEELEGVKRRAKARFLGSLDSNQGLARQLTRFEALTGDFREGFRQPDRIAAVTAEDVKRVAKQYFTKRNRTVATLVKIGKGGVQ